MSLTVSDSAIVFWSLKIRWNSWNAAGLSRYTVLASSTCGLSASAVPHALDLVLGGVGLHEDDELDAALPLHELVADALAGEQGHAEQQQRHRPR